MTDFMDPTVGNQRRQQLLQWMLQQGAGQQNAASPTGLGASMAPTPLGIGMAAARGGFGSATPFFSRGNERMGTPSFTNAPRLSVGLLARLGPGGAGRVGLGFGPNGSPSDQSAGSGLPVLTPQRSLGQPHQSLSGPAPLPVTAPVAPPPVTAPATTTAAQNVPTGYPMLGMQQIVGPGTFLAPDLTAHGVGSLWR